VRHVGGSRKGYDGWARKERRDARQRGRLEEFRMKGEPATNTALQYAGL
jgi:hypothetical protein